LPRIVAILGPPATPEPDNFPAAVARFFLDETAVIYPLSNYLRACEYQVLIAASDAMNPAAQFGDQAAWQQA